MIEITTVVVDNKEVRSSFINDKNRTVFADTEIHQSRWCGFSTSERLVMAARENLRKLLRLCRGKHRLEFDENFTPQMVKNIRMLL